MTKKVKLVLTQKPSEKRLKELGDKLPAAKTAAEIMEEILLRVTRIDEHLGSK